MTRTLLRQTDRHTSKTQVKDIHEDHHRHGNGCRQIHDPAKCTEGPALTETLRGAGPYTVFAPTDEAFKHLAPGALNALLKDTKKLKAILSYHVVSGTVAASDVKAGDIKTLEGTPLLAARDDKVTVNGAKVVQADMFASNGVIHAIDAVVMPKGWMLAAAA